MPLIITQRFYLIKLTCSVSLTSMLFVSQIIPPSEDNNSYNINIIKNFFTTLLIEIEPIKRKALNVDVSCGCAL